MFDDSHSGPSLILSGNYRNEDEAECPHYTTDSTGTRVGCHFHKLGKPKRTDNYFFLVNGTSRETAIQFLDFTPFVAYKIGETISYLASAPV